MEVCGRSIEASGVVGECKVPSAQGRFSQVCSRESGVVPELVSASRERLDGTNGAMRAHVNTHEQSLVVVIDDVGVARWRCVSVTGATSACGEESRRGMDGDGCGRFSGVLNDGWEVWRKARQGSHGSSERAPKWFGVLARAVVLAPF